MDNENGQTADANNASSDTAPLLTDNEESHSQPGNGTLDSTTGNYLAPAMKFRPVLGAIGRYFLL